MARPTKGNEIRAHTTLAIRLPVDLQVAIKGLANNAQSSVSEEVRKAIAEHVERRSGREASE